MSIRKSPETPDDLETLTTNTWINPWRHIVAGMHVGDMNIRPLTGEFGAVLTVAAEPGKVDEDIKHRHIPLSYINMDDDLLEEAVDWAFAQQQADRKLLIRSEGGKQRPSLIAALVCLRMGAKGNEALYCVRRGHPEALTDFRYVELFKAKASDADA
jgi:hypothetical protein